MAKSVLICDDAAFMRVMIKDILTKNGYDVAGEAENGLKAVEKYNETKPDLVMMDITMPEMDGIQALKKIKEADANATVIMCSAMGQQAMVIESIQSGAKDFIVKPFQVDRVLEAVVVVFVLVLAGTYYVTKWIAKSGMIQSQSRNIKVIETFKITNGKYIQIIQLGKKYYSIGVTKDQITFLTPLDEAQLDFSEEVRNGQKVSFKELLDKLNKNKKEN